MWCVSCSFVIPYKKRDSDQVRLVPLNAARANLGAHPWKSTSFLHLESEWKKYDKSSICCRFRRCNSSSMGAGPHPSSRSRAACMRRCPGVMSSKERQWKMWGIISVNISIITLISLLNASKSSGLSAPTTSSNPAWISGIRMETSMGAFRDRSSPQRRHRQRYLAPARTDMRHKDRKVHPCL